MLELRKSDARGQADHGWLKSQHSFSFADYYDAANMGFRSLRVINEDHIKGGTGFGSHPHRDMEIITYVVSGALEHKDSMGTKAAILPGEVQRMTAGTGVVHSEYNQQPDEWTHLLQIWIMPKERGGTPSYGQKSFVDRLDKEDLILAVSGDGRDGSISIKQDADLYISRLKRRKTITHELKLGRGAWVQLIRGRLDVNGLTLENGDAVAASDLPTLKIEALADSEWILFDLG